METLWQVVFDKLAIPLMEVFRNIWDRSDNLEKLKRNLLYYANRVREMFSKLQTCRDEGSRFNLKERRRPVSTKKETSSFVIESEVYGREKEVDNIVDVLLNCEATATHGVIRSISNDTCLCSSMEVLHSKVWHLLHKKKYLIISDDVWIEDQDEWERLRPLFRGVIVGSKIIITTRSKRVAMMMNCPTSLYYLEGLSDDACWSLFMWRAFQPGEREEHPDLLPIEGVALAAKTLGSLMRLKGKKLEGVVGCPK
ncbi:hypothetical protein FEM48_Zijuj09G0091500 [Ziziphus jujuba var. spinosa]|uniref:NB-ARC domain-containing protein n=1 Tax=Ziziphus jujuba var. spinosa TaxID=714518 RepID=A0A978US43_ZIZJJ|nr:hypothetical protein FEM48_Zijuj09G0091500 [Ziziphus jujuba var. spinosa]